MMAQHQKENMRAHLVAIQQIVAALGHDDFDAVMTATGRIGYSDTMAQMCTHMGAGAPGFTDLALNFHHTADTIGEAARRHDRGAVLAALGNTLQTCTGCHAAYRQQVVDEETWQRLTAGVPASHPHENQQ
jgi:cytochrome c556